MDSIPWIIISYSSSAASRASAYSLRCLAMSRKAADSCAYSLPRNARSLLHTSLPWSFWANQAGERSKYFRASFDVLISPSSSRKATHTTSDFTFICSERIKSLSQNCSKVIFLSSIFIVNLPPSVTRGLFLIFFQKAVKKPSDLIDDWLICRSLN